MEDPIRFDLWVGFTDPATPDLVAWLRGLRPELNEIEVRRQVDRSRSRKQPVLLAGSLTWQAAQRLRSELPNGIVGSELVQDCLGPANPTLHFCAVHDLWYGGCIGCHVCTGFFAP